MYVGLKQPRGDGEHYVTPARAAAKETNFAKDKSEPQHTYKILTWSNKLTAIET